MSGWPNRISRTSLGPVLVNPKPITDPTRQADANVFNLDFWTVGGLAQASPKAWAYFTTAGAAIQLVAHAEVWNPNRNQPAPVPAYVGAGQYTVTYLDTYPDASGDEVAHGILFPVARPVNTLTNSIGLASLAGSVVTVNLKTNPGNLLADFAFALFLW